MSLPRAVSRGLPLNAQVAPTSGHACQMLGNSVTLDMHVHSGTALLSALIRDSALALSLHSRS